MTTVTLKRVKRSGPSGIRLVWMLRWYDSDGKQLGETIGDAGRVNEKGKVVSGQMSKREAEAIRRGKQSKLDCGVIRADRPKRMTLAQFIEHDQATIRADVKPSTLVEYQIAGKHAIKAIGGDRPLTQIGWPQVGAVKDRLSTLGRSTATIRKTVATLRAMFNRALKQGLVTSNPFAGQRLPKVQSKQKRIYSREEVACMVEAVSDIWWQVFITLAVTSGLRRSELLHLQWRDIDLAGGTVTVSAKRAGTFEAGSETYPILEWSAKSNHERTVPLPDDTLAILQRLQLKTGGSAYVFLSLNRLAAIQRHIRDGKLPAKFNLVNNLNRQFGEIQDRARSILAKRCQGKVEMIAWPYGCLHDLRRTWCTWTADVVKMSTLQKWAGHQDIATTATFYCETTEDEAQRVRKALSMAASA